MAKGNEMTRKLSIPILLGTMRKKRRSEAVAHLMLEEANKHPEIEAELFDVKDMNLSGDEGSGLKEKNPAWRDAVIKADGLIIIAPEYNHGYPGSLKMAIDMLLKEYIHKAVGFVGVSRGGFGGTRVIEALVPMVRELGLVTTFADLNVTKVEELFDDAGKLKDKAYLERIDGFLTELVWVARVLCWGRGNLPSKYHEQSGHCRLPEAEQQT